MRRPLSLADLYFNPRSDERSDAELCSNNQQPAAISIHAPTNGATMYIKMFASPIFISIHAPTNGATIIS